MDWKSGTHNLFITWAQSNYGEDLESKVPIPCQRFYEDYEDECKVQGEKMLGKSVMGRIFCNLFPNVKIVTTTRNNTKIYVYKYLVRKSESNDICSLDSIVSGAPDSFFVVDQTSTEITFGNLARDTLNGMDVIKKLVIRNNGSWSLKVGLNEINPDILGLGGTVALMRSDINILFKTVEKANLCIGKAVDNHSLYSTECWSNKSKTEVKIYTIRSSQCLGVVSFSSSLKTCRPCQQMYLGKSKCVTKSTVLSKEANIPEKESVEQKLSQLFPTASPELLHFLKSQQLCLMNKGKDPRCRRWSKDIIQIALTLWIRSPSCYKILKDNMFTLPSESLLYRYKNSLDQKSGIHDQQLEWMNAEAIASKSEKSGGIILDEMSIQQEVSLNYKSQDIEVCGLVDLGSAANTVDLLSDHNTGVKVATHVLQFIFLGFDGFRFPFAWFPTNTVTAPELNIVFWEAVNKLNQWEFNPQYVCMDGASANRSFMNINLTEEDKLCNFSCPNIFRPSNSITFLMDYSHVIKRVRNNIYSSGKATGCTRLLCVDGHIIVWDHWISAYKWDRSTNPMRIHQRLTDEYIFLSNQSKMRNHFAEAVLDDDMLHLMTEYSKSLVNGKSLEGSLQLLKHTSVLVRNFRDPRPITSAADSRLDENQKVLNFFELWEKEVVNSNMSAGEKQKTLMSRETREDLKSLLIGFKTLCDSRVKQSLSVTAAGVNSDVVENIFCQQRAQHHGANNNPTVLQYQHGVAATILGQNIVSKKSNAQVVKRKAVPYCFNTKTPLTSKRKPLLSIENIKHSQME